MAPFSDLKILVKIFINKTNTVKIKRISDARLIVKRLVEQTKNALR